MRSWWNIFDGAIAVLGLLAWMTDLPVVSPLRLLRVARLVRVLHYAVEMKILVNSLVLSLPAVLNMLMLEVRMCPCATLCGLPRIAL